MSGRPSLLDNLRPDSGHGSGLVYLTNDLEDRHRLSVATGYVNLGGLMWITPTPMNVLAEAGHSGYIR